MSDEVHVICYRCGGKGCDKCHNGWECNKYADKFYPFSDIPNPSYGLDCPKCKRFGPPGAKNAR